LAAFESSNRVWLPEDLRLYLLTTNGIPFSQLDGLARLRPVADYFRIVDRVPAPMVRAADLADPERYYCFGDYNIEGSLWGIRLSDDPDASTPVRVFWHHSGGGQEVAASFREFLSRYLSEEPDALC
jgi:hypothetical protein